MNAVVAVDKNWAIGKNNKLLISIPEDMRLFQSKTEGMVVVVGKNTLESFPYAKPLRDRINIIIALEKTYKVSGAKVVYSIEEALEAVKKYHTDDVYVIGGASIYKQMLEYCKKVYVTKINFSYEADAYFPNLDEKSEWKLDSESEEKTYYDIEYTFCEYSRV